MVTPLRPAFYALPTGSWRDYVTVLHLPYTLWHLSYVVIGAALASSIHLDYLLGTLLAFLLGLGIGAHVLDELLGRPLRTRIPSWVLASAAAISIGGAVALGLAWSLTESLGLLPFVGFGAFIVVAYNLELFHSRFHNDFWFALAWGSFPMLTSYWVQARDFTVGAGLVAVACFLLSLAQRNLSREVRKMRRSADATHEGQPQAGDRLTAIIATERALKLLNATIVLLAAGLLAARA